MVSISLMSIVVWWSRNTSGRFLSTMKSRSFRAFVRRMSNAWGKCRWAIIFPSGKDASTAKLFVTLNEAFEESVSARLFRSMDEALAWAQAKTASEEPDK